MTKQNVYRIPVRNGLMECMKSGDIPTRVETSTREEKLVRALQAIVDHQDNISASFSVLSTTATIARRALAEYESSIKQLHIPPEEE